MRCTAPIVGALRSAGTWNKTCSHAQSRNIMYVLKKSSNVRLARWSERIDTASRRVSVSMPGRSSHALLPAAPSFSLPFATHTCSHTCTVRVKIALPHFHAPAHGDLAGQHCAMCASMLALLSLVANLSAAFPLNQLACFDQSVQATAVALCTRRQCTSGTARSCKSEQARRSMREAKRVRCAIATHLAGQPGCARQVQPARRSRSGRTRHPASRAVLAPVTSLALRVAILSESARSCSFRRRSVHLARLKSLAFAHEEMYLPAGVRSPPRSSGGGGCALPGRGAHPCPPRLPRWLDALCPSLCARIFRAINQLDKMHREREC